MADNSWHVVPPYWAAIVTLLNLDWVPPPQVTSQLVQADQAETWQLMEQVWTLQSSVLEVVREESTQ